MRTRAPWVALLAAVLLLVTGLPSSAGEAWVERQQERLNRLGCDAGPADGKVGDHTRAAVVRFQSANRMAQSGYLDQATRDRLASARAKKCVGRPVPARSGSGRRVVISQRQNWVWLVRKDGTVRAQGGIIDNPDYLGRGSYATGPQCGRAGRIAHNTDYSGRLWLHNFVRFANCGVGFHRIPTYRSNDQQIHPDWLVGTNYRESHGCIRLTRRMSRVMWDFTVSRTKVVVVTG